MWQYEKKLQYPVKIANPNPALAKVIISQLGGPDGELGAALRYLNQRYTNYCCYNYCFHTSSISTSILGFFLSIKNSSVYVQLEHGYSLLS